MGYVNMLPANDTTEIYRVCSTGTTNGRLLEGLRDLVRIVITAFPQVKTRVAFVL